MSLTGSLKSMEPSRKCFRMLGGVLAERTVGEVLPGLEETRSGVCSLSCNRQMLILLAQRFNQRLDGTIQEKRRGFSEMAEG